jgi:hypothetical protein
MLFVSSPNKNWIYFETEYRILPKESKVWAWDELLEGLKEFNFMDEVHRNGELRLKR